MRMIYAIVKISTHHITYKRTTHPYERTMTELRFNKDFLLCSIVMNLQILTNTFRFLPAFLHCNKRYSSKRKFRCITIPRSFCFPFSQILLLPIFAHNNSCFCPDIKKTIFFVYFHVVSLKPLNSQ